jgi:hypothetical protein
MNIDRVVHLTYDFLIVKITLNKFSSRNSSLYISFRWSERRKKAFSMPPWKGFQERERLAQREAARSRETNDSYSHEPGCLCH